MTPVEFEQKCREICPHCKAGIARRVRPDTLENVHDGHIEIPGMVGRRWAHAMCQAHDFRKEWEGKLSG